MPLTDFLRLNETEMFATIRANLPAEKKQTQNILECKDDLLYAWNAEDSCLLVYNWRAGLLGQSPSVEYQTLVPSAPQSFQVERVLASNEGSLIALSGPRGITILELPRRWGPDGQFMEGKEKITCRSYNLDAHFFNSNPLVEVRQLRWHPDSPTDSHLLVLLSDNTIRVYDNDCLRRVWQVGPVPSKSDVTANSSVPGLYALGEASVDFDIAPAVKAAGSHSTTSNRESTMKSEKIEWPIVVLRENGNIYVLMAGLEADRPRLQGPLTITPPSRSNYGTDSCALLVIPSLPVTLVIAESNGKLHNALLLEAEEPENSFNEVDSDLVMHPAEFTVHVLETVELELGLPKQDPNDNEYHCPIHLKGDVINELRYFAYHNTGLHVITINFVGELQRYLESSDVVSDVSALSVPSSAEYILCTKVDSSVNGINPVLGFALLQMPSGIVALLGSGQVISLKVVIDPRLLPRNKSIANKTGATANKEDQPHDAQPSFVDHIKGILRRNVTQPILSLDKNANLTPHESYELLVQTIEVLRSEYLKRHEVVRAEFSKRLNLIRMRKEQQRKDIEYLEKQREEIREKAHHLAERFEEISDQQEVVVKKCQELMRLANTCLPSNAIAEKEFAEEVSRINAATKKLSQVLQKAKESINKQTFHIQKYQESSKQKNFVLPEKQERVIKEVLLQITTEVDTQIKDVKRLNKVLGIPT